MKKYGVIGCLLFVAAVCISYFCDFKGAELVAVALAAFGLAAAVTAAVKKAKEKKLPTWKTVVIIALAAIGGVLCCIGGLEQSIFAELSGAAIALLTLIFGVIPELD